MHYHHSRSQRSGVNQHNAHLMIRLRHVETDEYLHLSGEGLTSNVHHSWLGTKPQARNLRDRWGAKTPWPFRAVRRDEHERPENVGGSET